MRQKSKEEFCVETWGPQACFSGPLKVDRVTYDVITPSSAKAIVSAIFDKPAIELVITKIEVMNPIQTMCIKINELSGAVIKAGNGDVVKAINSARNHVRSVNQRTNIILTDVRYRIYFRIEYIPVNERVNQTRESGSDESLEKYIAMFTRRARKGQCYKTPYFGKREYVANYRFIETPDGEKPINVTRDLGIMFYGYEDYTRAIETRTWFDCHMENGTIITDPEIIEIKKS